MRFRQWRRAVLRVRDSPRLRVIRLVSETNRRLITVMVLYVLADGFLPIVALIALGRAVGKIPPAIEHGLGSPSGHALLVALVVGTAAYGVSLLRSPAEALLEAYCSAAMQTGMQRRLARAVCAPEGIEHLENPEVLDRLASASGELSSSAPADAPMALASAFGDRLGGFLACVTLATFRWWIGVMFLIGWTAIRPPLRQALASRATLVRAATGELRHSWFYLGCSYRPAYAKEVRLFGLGDWVLDRHRATWLAGMAAPWRQMRTFQRQALLFGIVVAAMYLTGAGVLGLAAYHHEIALGTVAVMLPMFASTMQVGGITMADVSLEQMLAAVPDLDETIARLRATPVPGAADASGLPASQVRFEGVSYQYAAGSRPVIDGLDLELTAGQSLALVGINGAGKTTLVTLLARLRDPGGGRITVDGTNIRDLDARSWQRQVAVVYQDFTRYPLTARENVAFRDLGADVDEAALVKAAEQAGALELIRGLPHGWDTICSPGYAGGTDVSGGQWQRIALARALYAAARGARVLVLDEPTAQLDVRAEAAFYGSFLELTAGLTTMVISHRFATVRRASRIAVLDGGRITELGSHDELVAAGGSYAEMFALQAAQFTQGAHRG
ncbi:MAG TPA: ABC transporter ATP-binding protein [Streptosporangiaceae bacterium]|nr:ABC transporter ATP-binding protein [Streptosporangiaceae bacterium]